MFPALLAGAEGAPAQHGRQGPQQAQSQAQDRPDEQDRNIFRLRRAEQLQLFHVCWAEVL